MIEFEDRPRGLVRLIYASRSANGAVSREVATAIVAKSIQNNRVSDITGLLVIGGDRFLQVLEGPAGEVEQTFARVSQDPRHTDVTTIANAPGSKRLFRNWNMAHRQLGPDDTGTLNAVGLETFTPEGLDEERALKLLKTLGQAHLK
jgi:hypothetical protein